jgi:hypothetical protein
MRIRLLQTASEKPERTLLRKMPLLRAVVATGDCAPIDPTRLTPIGAHYRRIGTWVFSWLADQVAGLLCSGASRKTSSLAAAWSQLAQRWMPRRQSALMSPLVINSRVWRSNQCMR